MDILVNLVFFRCGKLCHIVESMDKIMQALLLSLRDIVKILVVMCMVTLIFSNMGIILYKNKFTFCEEIVNFEVSKEECGYENKSWINYP